MGGHPCPGTHLRVLHDLLQVLVEDGVVLQLGTQSLMLLPQGSHLLLGLGQLPQALPFQFPFFVGLFQGPDPFLVILLGWGKQCKSGKILSLSP